MKSYHVAKSTTAGFIGTFTFDQIESMLKAEVIKPDHVATDCIGLSYNQLLESSSATWVPVSQLQRPVETTTVGTTPSKPEAGQQFDKANRSGCAIDSTSMPLYSAVGWKLCGAVVGGGGLVAGAHAHGVPEAYREFVNPFVPVLLAIIALLGANVGALVGLFVSRFPQKRATKSALNNTEADSTPPLEGGDKPVKQGWGVMATINGGITAGFWLGVFVGWIYLTALQSQHKGEVSMGILLLPVLIIGFFVKTIIFATAGGLIGGLFGSLHCIFRRAR